MIWSVEQPIKEYFCTLPITTVYKISVVMEHSNLCQFGNEACITKDSQLKSPTGLTVCT